VPAANSVFEGALLRDDDDKKKEEDEWQRIREVKSKPTPEATRNPARYLTILHDFLSEKTNSWRPAQTGSIPAHPLSPERTPFRLQKISWPQLRSLLLSAM
jgi:hypothetical protein